MIPFQGYFLTNLKIGSLIKPSLPPICKKAKDFFPFACLSISS